MCEQPDTEVTKTLYEECGTHLRHMLEWRHKLMLRFFVVNASLLVVTSYLIDREKLGLQAIAFLPLLISALLSVAIYVMDRRTMQVVKVCRDTGAEIERTMFRKAGVFVNMGPSVEETRGLLSYTGMLAAIYLGYAAIMLACAIGALIAY